MNEARRDATRLPTNVLPRRYDLTIAPDLSASTFTGEVTIELEVVAPTATILLNAKDLDIEAATLVQAGASRSAAVAVLAELQRIEVSTDAELAPGPATLTLRFGGEISHGLLGFYRSTFTDIEGREQVLAATQFEAPHARAAFPCFDEPEFKAVFAVTLEVADNLLAISNGPEVGREAIAGNRVRVRFGETIAMSTYLVAWVVGPLEITPPVDAGGVAVRVMHVPGRGHLTAFALDLGAFAIQYFADYYGLPYPGEKCDLVALPDFSFGAMENLGCVTFRESRLLLDPEAVTLDEMAAAALTIVHEIAHMWFGDLVTMKWWNGIWLNEAFARFMEQLGADAYRPEWKVWDDFATSRAGALDVDALASTRTIEYEVVTPEDADGMFDVLTYDKGGSVLRMLERWLGAEAFRAGVRHYLEQYQYANTETTDLWDALEAATGKPVRKIMDTWIFQPGFPAIARDGNALTQKQFTYPGNDADGSWVVPVLARVHAGGTATTTSLLLPDDPTITAPADALVVLNAGGDGFYRVLYSESERARLLDAGVLEPLERFALLDDLWAAMLAGSATAEEFITCARRFEGETELVVWRLLAARLRTLGRLVTGDALERLRGEVGAIVRPTMERIGWDGRPDDLRARQTRALAVGVLGGFVGDQEAIARSREIEERGGGDADLESACVSVVAAAGTADDFERYVQQATTADNPQVQLRYLYALGEFPEETLVLRATELALSDAVRSQNGPFLMQRALRNRDNGPAAWAFVRDHWDTITGRYSHTLIPRLLEGTNWLVEGNTPDDVTRFIEAHPVKAGTRTVAQHLERLRVNRATVDRERERFSASLLRD